MKFKRMLAAGAAALALAGCSGTDAPTAAPANTVAVVATTEAPAITDAPTDPVEATSEPTQEAIPEAEEVADTLDELLALSQRQYNNQLMEPALRDAGKAEFCKPTEMQPNPDDEGGAFLTVNPGADFAFALFFGAAFAEDTTEETYTEEDMAQIVDWTNEFYETTCDWTAPSTDGVDNAEEEAAANEGAAEALGPDSIGAWDKEGVNAALTAADQPTKDLVCEGFNFEGDVGVFYGDEFDQWTPEQQQQAGLWVVDWALVNCM